VDVLKRFGMMDCKSISTPMVTNMRKQHDSDTGSDLVDPVDRSFSTEVNSFHEDYLCRRQQGSTGCF
jgi:hypothetical protein